MATEKEIAQQNSPGEENAENDEQVQNVQFNELSEVSLEARMNVADQLGIPVNNLGEAAALGTMRDRDNNAEDLNERMEEKRREEPDQ